MSLLESESAVLLQVPLVLRRSHKSGYLLNRIARKTVWGRSLHQGE